MGESVADFSVDDSALLPWLQSWSTLHCFGDGFDSEHGVLAETLSEPGWRLDIGISGTELAGGSGFAPYEKMSPDGSTVSARVVDDAFVATCGPTELGEAIAVFMNWARCVRRAPDARSFDLNGTQLVYDIRGGGPSTITWLQEWYAARCDGLWEAGHGVRLSEIDNPGWRLEIDLADTRWSHLEFARTTIERDEQDWIVAWTVDERFHVACGPLNLNEALSLFRSWIDRSA
jgi:hypothetical protein